MTSSPLSQDQKQAGLDLARRLVSSANQAGQALELDLHAEDVFDPRGLTFLDELDRNRLDRQIRQRLLDAGNSLLVTLTEVSQDDALWTVLERCEGAVTGPSEVSSHRAWQLREILSQDIPGILRSLGYVTPPPPPAEQWAVWFQRPLEQVLSSGPSDGEICRTARTELRYFLMRLRRVLQASGGWLGFEAEHPDLAVADPLCGGS